MNKISLLILAVFLSGCVSHRQCVDWCARASDQDCAILRVENAVMRKELEEKTERLKRFNQVSKDGGLSPLRK